MKVGKFETNPPCMVEGCQNSYSVTVGTEGDGHPVWLLCGDHFKEWGPYRAGFEAGMGKPMRVHSNAYVVAMEQFLDYAAKDIAGCKAFVDLYRSYQADHK